MSTSGKRTQKQRATGKGAYPLDWTDIARGVMALRALRPSARDAIRTRRMRRPVYSPA